MIKILINLLIFFAATTARAAGGEGHDAHHIPWSELIVPQVINFTIFVTVLFFLLKGKVVEFFAQKQTNFQAAMAKAQEAKLTAENANAEVRRRLQKLEESAKESLAEAKKQAALVRERLIREAQEAAQKMEVEAERSSKYEHEKAIAALRMELITNAMKVAEDEVRAKSASGVNTELQKAFLQKLEGAQP